MNFLNASVIFLTLTSFSVHADEVSKKACENFLPAFGDQNIGLILNGFKREFKDDDKGKQRFDEILKATEDLINDDAQKRCDAGLYPIMNLDVCYMKCKGEAEKRITGTYAWNVSARYFNMNLCYQACTGAYVAQGAITRTLRKTASDSSQCGNTSTNIVDTRKAKQIENILMNIDQGEAAKGTSK